VLAAGGCSPDTVYRFTALTPAARPLAWDGRIARRGAPAPRRHAEPHGRLWPRPRARV